VPFTYAGEDAGGKGARGEGGYNVPPPRGQARLHLAVF